MIMQDYVNRSRATKARNYDTIKYLAIMLVISLVGSLN